MHRAGWVKGVQISRSEMHRAGWVKGVQISRLTEWNYQKAEIVLKLPFLYKKMPFPLHNLFSSYFLYILLSPQ